MEEMTVRTKSPSVKVLPPCRRKGRGLHFWTITAPIHGSSVFCVALARTGFTCRQTLLGGKSRRRNRNQDAQLELVS